MRTRKVALAVFYNNQKEILLQNRRDISRIEEEWGFFGGEIEKDETPEKALVREIKEELNFEIKEYRFIFEFKKKISENFILDRFVFTAPLNDNLEKFRQSEGSGMKLFSLDEAEKLKMAPGDELIIEEMKQIL